MLANKYWRLFTVFTLEVLKRTLSLLIQDLLNPDPTARTALDEIDPKLLPPNPPPKPPDVPVKTTPPPRKLPPTPRKPVLQPKPSPKGEPFPMPL
jgi:hypothetical protein